MLNPFPCSYPIKAHLVTMRIPLLTTYVAKKTHCNLHRVAVRTDMPDPCFFFIKENRVRRYFLILLNMQYFSLRLRAYWTCTILAAKRNEDIFSLNVF